MMKVNLEKPSHGALFNIITGILGEIAPRHVYFSDRLACTNQVLEFLEGWVEQWQHGETFTYKELKEQGG